MNLLSLFLLELPVFFLAAGKGKRSLIISSVIFMVFIILLWAAQRKRFFRLTIWIEHPVMTGMICAALVTIFSNRWGESFRLEKAAEHLALSLKQTSILTALILALFALPGIDISIRAFFSLFSISLPHKKGEFEDLFRIFYILVTAFLVILLNSRSSVLYPINDWVDPNTMFTVGKGVLKGYVPYADLYEQKGPLLIFIHTLGAFFSYDSFLGIWIIEITSCFITLLLVYKISKLYFDKNILFLIPLAAALLFGSQSFSPGDTAEEYCLPLIAYGIYVSIKAIQTDQFSSKSVCFLLGLTSGCVFWIKYTITGFYLGWFIFFFTDALQKKKLTEFGKGLLWILAGVISASIPIICYFVFHSALDSLFEAYFYNNIFLYADRQTAAATRILNGFLYYAQCAPAQLILTLFGLLWFITRKSRQQLFFSLLTLLSSVIFIYIGGMYHGYSGIPLSLFAIFGLLGIWDVITRANVIRSGINHYALSLSLPCLLLNLITVSAFSNNMRYLDHTKEDWFQYKMKAVIEQSGIRQPTILFYNMGDAGINTVSELIPNLRFFCYYHNPNLEDMVKEQRECIENQCADFIVTFAKNERFYPRFETYEHTGYFMGVREEGYPYYHYYVPLKDR